MNNLQYIFGPVPSRRLGRSLGVSPIPGKTCNYSCIYCQLGRTGRMTNERQEFFPLGDILAEFDAHHDESRCDVVTVVGEGEPTLYSRLGELIAGLKKRTARPVAVITNGALLYDEAVRRDLMEADIVLPSLDACDPLMYRKIDRPYGRLDFHRVTDGLIRFTHEYTGQLYLEIMLMDGINDDTASLYAFRDFLKKLRYDRVYINTPVRPPAETAARVSSPEAIRKAVELLGGISIDMLAAGSFSSDIPDDYEAVCSIIARHPMNQHELNSFLESRGSADGDAVRSRLSSDPRVVRTEYKGYITYRLK